MEVYDYNTNDLLAKIEDKPNIASFGGKQYLVIDFNCDNTLKYVGVLYEILHISNYFMTVDTLSRLEISKP